MTGRLLFCPGPRTAGPDLPARLRAAWFEVIAVPCGREALAAARAGAADLVLADTDAPGLPGLALCRALRADPATAALPVVLLAPPGAPGARLAGLRVGADEVAPADLPDPELPARLRARLRAAGPLDGLPLSLGAAQALDRAAAAAGPAPARPLLLVGPDGPAARRRAAQLARALDLPVRRAADPAEALRRAGDERPDLILLAPAPGGPEAAALISALRARPDLRGAALAVLAPGAGPEAVARALDLGAWDVIAEPETALPEGARLADLAARRGALLRRTRRADRLRGALDDGLRLAWTDPLTGLPNRRAVEAQAPALIARCAAEGRPLAALMLDLDAFKSVNDRHGHAAGDAVLRGAALRLQAALGPAGTLARLGGEEFLALLPGAGPAEARAAAERLRAAIAAAPLAAPPGPIAVTVSIGAAVLDPAPPRTPSPTPSGPTPGRPPAAPRGFAEPAAPFGPRRAPAAPGTAPGTMEDRLADLLARADAALYACKAVGRNCITVAAA